MITWTTYGTWLQGDSRQYIKNGTILSENQDLQNINKSLMKSKTFKLDSEQKIVVRDTIISESNKNNQNILALAVSSNHIHIVAMPCEFEISQLVRNYKSKTWQALKKIGIKQKIWTRGYNKVFCFTNDKLKEKIEYVNQHNKH